MGHAKSMECYKAVHFPLSLVTLLTSFSHTFILAQERDSQTSPESNPDLVLFDSCVLFILTQTFLSPAKRVVHSKSPPHPPLPEPWLHTRVECSRMPQES